MLALHRFVAGSERTGEVTAQARAALAALAGRPGYRGGELTRALDDPAHWCLVTRWESVGAYRRAWGDQAVRVAATPLLAGAAAEPSAYEVLAAAPPGGPVTGFASDRAEPGRGAEPDHGGPDRGDRAAPDAAARPEDGRPQTGGSEWRDRHG